MTNIDNHTHKQTNKHTGWKHYHDHNDFTQTSSKFNSKVHLCPITHMWKTMFGSSVSYLHAVEWYTKGACQTGLGVGLEGWRMFMWLTPTAPSGNAKLPIQKSSPGRNYALLLNYTIKKKLNNFATGALQDSRCIKCGHLCFYFLYSEDSDQHRWYIDLTTLRQIHAWSLAILRVFAMLSKCTQFSIHTCQWRSLLIRKS